MCIYQSTPVVTSEYQVVFKRQPYNKNYSVPVLLSVTLSFSLVQKKVTFTLFSKSKCYFFVPHFHGLLLLHFPASDSSVIRIIGRFDIFPLFVGILYAEAVVGTVASFAHNATGHPATKHWNYSNSYPKPVNTKCSSLLYRNKRQASV